MVTAQNQGGPGIERERFSPSKVAAISVFVDALLSPTYSESIAVQLTKYRSKMRRLVRKGI
jgi:hypothetical protein